MTTDVSHAYGRVLVVLRVEMRKLEDWEPLVLTVFCTAVFVDIPGNYLAVFGAS